MKHLHSQMEIFSFESLNTPLYATEQKFNSFGSYVTLADSILAANEI